MRLASLQSSAFSHKAAGLTAGGSNSQEGLPPRSLQPHTHLQASLGAGEDLPLKVVPGVGRELRGQAGGGWAVHVHVAFPFLVELCCAVKIKNPLVEASRPTVYLVELLPAMHL